MLVPAMRVMVSSVEYDDRLRLPLDSVHDPVEPVTQLAAAFPGAKLAVTVALATAAPELTSRTVTRPRACQAVSHQPLLTQTVLPERAFTATVWTGGGVAVPVPSE